MNTLLVIGLIATAFAVGRIYQWIRDARQAMGAHTNKSRRS